MNILYKELFLISDINNSSQKIDFVLNNINKKERNNLIKITNHILKKDDTDAISDRKLNQLKNKIANIKPSNDSIIDSDELNKNIEIKNNLEKIAKIITCFTEDMDKELRVLKNFKMGELFTNIASQIPQKLHELSGVSELNEFSKYFKYKEIYSKENFGGNLIKYLKKEGADEAIKNIINGIKQLEKIENDNIEYLHNEFGENLDELIDDSSQTDEESEEIDDDSNELNKMNTKIDNNSNEINENTVKTRCGEGFYAIIDECLNENLKLERNVNYLNKKYKSLDNFIDLVEKKVFSLKTDLINTKEEISESFQASETIEILKDFSNFSNFLYYFMNNIRKIDIIHNINSNHKITSNSFDDFHYSKESEFTEEISEKEIKNTIKEIQHGIKQLNSINIKMKQLLINNKKLKKTTFNKYQELYFSEIKKINENLKKLNITPLPINSDKFLTVFFYKNLKDKELYENSNTNEQLKLSRKDTGFSHSYYIIKDNFKEEVDVIRKYHKKERNVHQTIIKTEETYIKEGGINTVRKFGISISNQHVYIHRTPKRSITNEEKIEMFNQAKNDIELFKNSKYVLTPKIINYKSSNEDKQSIIYPFIPFEFNGDFCSDKSPKEIAIIITQIAKGIQEMHEKKYVHFDIKEPNILIDEKQSVFITDLDGKIKFDSEDKKIDFSLMATKDYLPIKFRDFAGKKVKMNFEEGKLCDAYALARIVCNNLKHLKAPSLEKEIKNILNEINNSEVKSDDVINKIILLLEKL